MARRIAMLGVLLSLVTVAAGCVKQGAHTVNYDTHERPLDRGHRM